MEIVHQTATSVLSLGEAMDRANTALRENLSTTKGDLSKISISHSSGYAQGMGFFVTIIATVPAKTPEPGIASMF